MDKQEVLQQCTVDGFIVKLPDVQLDRKLYLDVAKSLNLIGGKWKGGKVAGFVFQQDPTELLEQIQNGEQRNLKKEYQFFATPDEIADRLVYMALLDESHLILEPSAGQGAIINAINRIYPDEMVDCYELMDVNRTFLLKIPTANIIGNDFLEATPLYKYDRIIANPPFSKNQDIDHIMHMWKFLKEGGRLVTVASKHWEFSTFKKETEFKNWIYDNATSIEDIEQGQFKSSGTMIGMKIIVLDK